MPFSGRSDVNFAPETLRFSEHLLGSFRNMSVLVRSSSMKTGTDPPCPDEAFIAAVGAAQ